MSAWPQRFRSKLERLILLPLLLLWLYLRNRLSATSITAAGGPVVSLTSYGLRADRVYFAIESIAWGTAKPSRLVLWLDDPKIETNLPVTLRRLRQRGLEIRMSARFGPHCKYYPYVSTERHHSNPLVTADDDIIYPRWWLFRLVEASRSHPQDIHCYRARVVRLNECVALLPYRQWPFCGSTRAKYSHLLTGVSGVIYPPAFLDHLRRSGTEFMQVSPKADDLWLHAQAIRAGYKVRQMYARPIHFPVVPGTDELTLQGSNVDAGGNDRQAQAVYRESDISIIRSEHDDSDQASVTEPMQSSGRASNEDLLPMWNLLVKLTD